MLPAKMSDLGTLTAAGLAAAFSTASMALFGVDYYSMLYGFVGALFAVMQTREHMGRLRAVSTVILSTLVGAAIGNAAFTEFGWKARPMLIIGCLIGGAGAQLIVRVLVGAAVRHLRIITGSSE